MKVSYIMFFFSLLFSSCNNNNVQIKKIEEKIKNEAVFVIKNQMEGVNVSLYKDIDFKTFEKPHFYTKKTIDTINLSINPYDIVYISSKYNAKEKIYIKVGDTIHIELKDSILNFYSNSNLNQFIKSFKDDIPKNLILDSIKKTFYHIDSTKALKLMANQFEKPNPIYRYKINREKFVDDSLGVNQLLNEEISENNKQLLIIDKLFKKNKIDKRLMTFLKNESNKNLFSTLLINYNFSKLKIFLNNLKSEKFISESNLLNNRYKYEILITYINLAVLKGRVEKSRSKLFIDYIKAYKNLPNFLSGDLLKDARKICLYNSFQQDEEISKIFSIYNDFKRSYKDSIFINSLDEKYLIRLKKIEDSLNIKDVFLIDRNKQKNNFKNILNQNKGKLIYIDFWASWCAPCRAAMPNSKQLFNEYKNREIVFIYVSIDKNFEKWESASKEENLFTYKNNVLAINYPSANFYKELNLKTIPRYILYDKKGKLVHENAPGPEGVEIRKLLNEYLNK